MDNKKPLVLTYDQLVVGSSLEAFLFAFHSKCPVIYTRNLQPYPFEIVNDFGLGTDKLDIWKKLAFQLSLSGRIPFENKIKIIRYVDSNTLKIITEDSRPYFIKYNYLHVFDDTEFYDLPAHIGVQPAKKLVVDYFKIKSSWNQSRETINSNDDLFKHIIFMAPPGREEHEVRKKYLMVASYIDGEPLPEYTSRIKLTKLLEEKFGISDIDIEHEKREVVDYSRNLYDDFSGVSFVYVDAQYIHSKHNPWYKMDFMKYLRIMLGIKW